jgi:hypothetical protein
MMRKVRIGIVVAVMLALAGFVAVRAYNPGGFDASRWQAQRGSDAIDNPRGGMVSDLMQRLRPGMTRADVRVLLGAPDGESDARWTYELGASRYGVDYEYFVIEFDAEGRLARHALMRG